MIWKGLVIFSSLAAYLYLLITEWVNLFPWNDVSTSTAAQKLSGSLINVLPFALVIAGALLEIDWLKLAGMGLFLLLLGVHFAWFWVPYLWGTSRAHLEQYARLFGRTYKFLPARGANPIPDAHYVTYQLLVLFNLLIGFVALAKGGEPRG